MRIPRLSRLALVCLLGALLASMTPSLAARWATYENARFGYSVRYPADIFTRAQPSENGDGTTLLARSGMARMIVFGGLNALGHDARTMADQLAGLEDIREVTYRRVTQEWIVLSGYIEAPQSEAPVIFYERVEFNADRSAISGFRLEYPTTMRDQIDDLIGPIGRSLTPPALD